jgi:carbonic anhydrase/acetyltransferase-like protein (isoleucine patch superfamily)
MPTKPKPSAVDFVDIDGCTYLGSRATTSKYITRVKLPDGSVVHAWCDNKPSIPIGTECSVEHNTKSDVFNIYS